MILHLRIRLSSSPTSPPSPSTPCAALRGRRSSPRREGGRATIFNKLNREKIKQNTKKCAIIEQDESQTPNQEKEGYFGQAIIKLTRQRQKELLLNNIRIRAEPTLHRPILTHSPTTYHGAHLQTSTSLGIIDAKCKQLATFCRRELGRSNTRGGRINTKGKKLHGNTSKSIYIPQQLPQTLQ